MKKEFNLEGKEYIVLGKLLKLADLVSSGGEAKQLIKDGFVKVNEEVVFQRGAKIRPGMKVTLENDHLFVKE